MVIGDVKKSFLSERFFIVVVMALAVGLLGTGVVRRGFLIKYLVGGGLIIARDGGGRVAYLEEARE